MARLIPALFLSTLALAGPAHAQLFLEGETTPAPIEEVGRDDARRKPILDALRPAIETALGQKVIFKVDRLRAQGSWAFAVVYPRTPAGAKIDFATTPLKEAAAEGLLDGDTIFALLAFKDGGWTMVEQVIGPTDVAYAGWPEAHGVPAELLGLTP
ncbi:hypothetical protein [Zavarzinia compransoris]|uniref:Uncharacterized protein n=1 Tax=Zavarzinia compransoris TaxID=1264899 RepID=A0A317E9P7_9PROT|nr:hypothetical protein [Zavarzinia compransoris]PWR23629.1 hypothetical protein DKG75_03425 [Zavarzinia compransoris]TDP47848.1 hypothetical protein DES42_102144 [Zavarzinia compransoris]